MTHDPFKERERALEEEFFHRVNQQLIDELKKQLRTAEEIEKLARTTGFHDHQLLCELVDEGVSAEALAAMALVPLILVAWADGTMAADERAPIKKAALEYGIVEGTAADKLLQHWLEVEPTANLATTWEHYIQAVIETVSDKTKKAMKEDAVARARGLAKAAGGTLGIGAISPSEQRVINRVKEAFQ